MMKSLRFFPALFAVFSVILLPAPPARAVPGTDPVNQFADTGPLQTARRDHTATLLHDGTVLVAGGFNGSTLNSTELYDPASGRWSGAGNFTARRNHTATLLPDGTVLVVGGRNASILSSAQVYHPGTQRWQGVGSLVTARYQHTATLLPDGTVLVVGGTGTGGELASAEIYHPDTQTWTVAASLTSARTSHTATVSNYGNTVGVEVLGGSRGTTFVTGREIYLFSTKAWQSYGSITTGRSGHTATLIDYQGRIVIAGGIGSSGTLASVERYDPLSSARSSHSATRLPDGRILLAGGLNGSTYLSSAETLEGTFGGTGTVGSLRFARAGHTATLLTSGRVLIAGGYNGSSYLSSAELFDPDTAAWSSGPALDTARGRHTATLLSSGNVLVAGGAPNNSSGSGVLASAELFNPASNRWSPTGAMSTARRSHTATLLKDGRVLVAAGTGVSGSLTSSEIYDPLSGRWSATGPLSLGRTDSTATLLPNGKVLVAGGTTNSAELYNPATGIWNSTGAMSGARTGHTATLLPDGMVLVVGGGAFPTFDAELYNPATGTWSSADSSGPRFTGHTATLLSSRYPEDSRVLLAGNGTSSLYRHAYDDWSGGGTLVTGQERRHTATLLANGSVLIAGGQGTGPALATASFFDPAQDKWIQTADLAGARESHSATLLLDGRVLAAGGFNGPAAVSTVEIFNAGLNGVGFESQPGISSATLVDGKCAIAGTQLSGLLGSSGSSGNSQDSPTGYPLVQCRSLANDETAWLSFEDSTTIQDGGLRGTLASVPGAGLMRVTVFANGTPSASVIIDNLHSDTAYDASNNASYSAGQTAGRNAVTSSPNSYSLYSQAQYNANFTTGQNAVLAAPNTFNLYSLSQVQALNVGTPLIQRNALGQFKLTIAVEKSATLLPGSFVPFPMSAPQTVINAQGQLDFSFTSPDNAAFFQVESH